MQVAESVFSCDRLAKVSPSLFLILLGFLLPQVTSLQARPNVLFIAVDDLRVELGCYGSEHVISPNIDRLAEKGTLFERAYCQQTVCNPSRASLLTGLRPDTLRVWDLYTHFRQNSPDLVTLPQLFKQEGYEAVCVGKIFHNWRQDQWRGDRVSWSQPEFLHYATHGNDQPQIPGDLPPNLASGAGGLECRDVPDEAYYDGRVANKAVEALRSLKRNEKPFFLAVGFWKPHTPFNAPKKYWDRYERDAVPVPRHLDPPENIPEIALTSSRYDGSSNRGALREMHHGHLAAITYLDTQIGKVLDEIDTLGLREETVIVFWSDHGLHLGEHGLTRKTTAFELDAAVPMIISMPGQSSGQRTKALVELLDVYPTLVELCDLTAPHALQGKSLVRLVEDPSAEFKSAVLTQTPRPNYPKGKMPEAMGYSIRTDQFRYTEWRDFKSDRVIARELYDHDKDPLETVNVIGDDGYQKWLSDLEMELEELVSQ
ncbi:sulfatase [bacterium]|jgi:iduronate 2-sulfatase|nr:sulfatase [bacterium]MDA7667573.1 sulfatase [bacterium]